MRGASAQALGRECPRRTRQAGRRSRRQRRPRPRRPRHGPARSRAGPGTSAPGRCPIKPGQQRRSPAPARGRSPVGTSRRQTSDGQHDQRRGTQARCASSQNGPNSARPRPSLRAPARARAGPGVVQVGGPDPHSDPLVEGMAPAARGSGSTAMRSARATDLKQASATWCALVPARRVTCRVSRRVHGEGAEELLEQLGVHLADLVALEPDVPGEEGPAGQVQRRLDQRLVHRQRCMAVAADAALVAERLGQRLAQHDAHILGGVVEVDVQVALGAHVQVEQRVPGKRGQHVVEEADAGRDVRPARRRPGPASA